MSCYEARLEKMWDWMACEGIALLVFEDAEGRRDSTIRWLTGHPGDALLFLSSARKSFLVPWDIILAKAYARADMIIPYGDFDRMPIRAIRGAAEKLKIAAGSKIEIPPETPYPTFLEFVGELADFDVICREKSAASHARNLRAVKDAEEIAIIRRAAGITNKMIDLLEKNVRSGKIKTEADAAMFIEAESRKRGCDGTGFETLAAGPDRSFGIHAFPAWTAASFAGQGLSILDFGLKFGGYNTDVTLTFVRDPSPQQQKMVNLVEKAAKLAAESIINGNETTFPALAVETLFAKSKKRLVHRLGHGIGLDVHERPYISNRPNEEHEEFVPGMVFAVEPGLYDPIHGGCRLENDFLMTETGCEVLTAARIMYL
ncbi:MAG: Xaa-Pro peptidase family protein [Treponema sp.]|nr:Xaa-Pro peptidase family protein [Treponema sp.]